ncbi:MAG: hypothetical protein HQL52_19360 [Magnetococcales bacterium]|nr:hypothetical protein [Magnetococcales bacterium]
MITQSRNIFREPLPWKKLDDLFGIIAKTLTYKNEPVYDYETKRREQLESERSVLKESPYSLEKQHYFYEWYARLDDFNRDIEEIYKISWMKILENLDCEKFIGFGLTSPHIPQPKTIPPHEWHFLDIDPMSAQASGPDLQYVGIRFLVWAELDSDQREIVSAWIRQAQSEASQTQGMPPIKTQGKQEAQGCQEGNAVTHSDEIDGDSNGGLELARKQVPKGPWQEMYQEWIEEAKKLQEENPTWTKIKIAKEISKNSKLNPKARDSETIRRRISQYIPS